MRRCTSDPLGRRSARGAILRPRPRSAGPRAGREPWSLRGGHKKNRPTGLVAASASSRCPEAAAPHRPCDASAQTRAAGSRSVVPRPTPPRLGRRPEDAEKQNARAARPIGRLEGCCCRAGSRGIPSEGYGSRKLFVRRHRLTHVLSSCSVRLQSPLPVDLAPYGFSAPTSSFVATNRTAPRGSWVAGLTRRSHGSPPLLSLASRSEYDLRPLCPETLHRSRGLGSRTILPWGLGPFGAFKTRTATCTGLASPGCAASSGFLNLLTPYSVLAPSGLVSCQWHPWALGLQSLSLAVARSASRPLVPLMPLAVRSRSSRFAPESTRLQGFEHPSGPCPSARG